MDQGAGSIPFWPSGEEPRDWQQDFMRALRQLPDERRDFLLEACPGAGKTKAVLAAARMWLDEGLVKRLLVVCPSVPLKKQWAKAAAEFGIYLNYNHQPENGEEAEDEHGIVATYPHVARYPHVYRRQNRRDTLTLPDELHHAGIELIEGGAKRNLPWADGLISAVSASRFILSTTATPFRTDGFELPFVSYDRSDGPGRTLPDYRYSYGRALEDHVCRPIFFPEYEGKVRWEKRGEIHEGYLTAKCPSKEESNLIRQAVHKDGEWIKARLRNANDRLNALRQSGDRRAAGLVLALDQRHARDLSELLRKTTGVEAKLAISDDPDASKVIEDFEASDDPWLVSVRMVSEGVDIKRLRVCVYASNWLTWLYFLQVCGRIWRWDDRLDKLGIGRNQSAWMYLPATKTLVDYAARIMEVREHYLRAGGQERTPHTCHCAPPPPPPPERARFISADQGRAVRVHVNGREVPEADVKRAEAHVRQLFDDPQMTVPEPNLEKVILYLREHEGPLEDEARSSPVDITAEKAALSKRLSKMIWEYACMCVPDGSLPDQAEVSKERRRIAWETDRWLRLQTDGKPNLASTLENLRRRIKALGLRLAGFEDADDDAQRGPGGG